MQKCFELCACHGCRMLRKPSSAQRISEILGVGKRQTERTLKSLREKGLIFREGGTRGFWKILEAPQDQ